MLLYVGRGHPCDAFHFEVKWHINGGRFVYRRGLILSRYLPTCKWTIYREMTFVYEMREKMY